MAKKSPKEQCKIMDENWDVVVTSTEFIPERFYFVVLRTPYKPHYTQNMHFFTIDDELKYDPFLEDFGPLNLALLYRYCFKLNLKLKMSSLMSKKIVHFTTLKPKKRVNAAYLAGAYAIIYLNMPPNEVYNKLNKKEAPPYKDFRDASNGCPLYEISLLDCLNAVYQAHKHNFFNFEDFNVNEYEFYETVQNGDLNWIVPNKFLAFAGPQSKNYLNFVKGRIVDPLIRTPESYIKYFRDNNVTTIVRLNNKLYDASKFTREGFMHVDLFFIDGSTPSDDLLNKFLTVSENAEGAVAVHCKAGLGRTGSMIACYIMKWYRFSAREAIAWLRICRPASIIGHQQGWLEMKQSELWNLNSKVISPKHDYGVYSYKSKLSMKKKLLGGRNSAKAMRISSGDNVTKIADKVDSMSIVGVGEDENTNEGGTLNSGSHLKIGNGNISLTSLRSHGKDENKNSDLFLKKREPSHPENCSLDNFSFEQGDMLNEIKAKRLSRNQLGSKSGRKNCCGNSTSNVKKVIIVEKSNARRPITRSKSSQSPSSKNIIINEAVSRPAALGSPPAVKTNASGTLNMTLRSSNRLHSLRHSRVPDTRICKVTSVR